MTDKNNRTSLKGISRIDSKSTHGWFVRVYRYGETYRKFFSDSVHGGEEKALQAAVAHRDELYRQHPRPDVPFYTKPTKRNSSGIPGVSESYQHWGKRKRKVRCFTVFWAPRRGERCTKRFYFHHYDSREDALQAAIEFRKAREREIEQRYKSGEYIQQTEGIKP